MQNLQILVYRDALLILQLIVFKRKLESILFSNESFKYTSSK